MASQRQTLFGDAYVRCPACASWMPNRSSACTECGYQPALGKVAPVVGYAAVRVLTGVVLVALLGFSVVYAHKDQPPPAPKTTVQTQGLDIEPPNPAPNNGGFSSDAPNNTPETFDVRSRSYVNQFVVDYMKTHLPEAKTGDLLDIPTASGDGLEKGAFIQVLKYRVLFEGADGSEREIHFAKLPDETRIRTDESFRRQHQRRETERLWKLRNQPDS